MVDVLLYVFLFALLALAAVAGVWLARTTLAGQSPMTALFGERPEKRLAVIEHASVDGRRRLLLIRRDDVEHLIMTGGPVDVVIETGIGENQRRETTGKERTEPARAETDAPEGGTVTPTFGRQARAFGRPAQTRAAE